MTSVLDPVLEIVSMEGRWLDELLRGREGTSSLLVESVKESRWLVEVLPDPRCGGLRRVPLRLRARDGGIGSGGRRRPGWRWG